MGLAEFAFGLSRLILEIPFRFDTTHLHFVYIFPDLQHLSLMGLAKFVLHLGPLNPENPSDLTLNTQLIHILCILFF